MNTVLTALGCGVPLVATPITNEQPGIAARLVRTKAVTSIPLANLDDTRLHAAIADVLNVSSYRQNAQRMQKIIEASGGVERAATMIELVAQTGQPVTAETAPNLPDTREL